MNISITVLEERRDKSALVTMKDLSQQASFTKQRRSEKRPHCSQPAIHPVN